MQSRVYVTVCCLSVCPIDRPQQWHVAGSLLWALHRQMSMYSSGRWAVVLYYVCMYACVIFLFCNVVIITFISVMLVLILSFYYATIQAVFICLRARTTILYKKYPHI